MASLCLVVVEDCGEDQREKSRMGMVVLLSMEPIALSVASAADQTGMFTRSNSSVLNLIVSLHGGIQPQRASVASVIGWWFSLWTWFGHSPTVTGCS